MTGAAHMELNNHKHEQWQLFFKTIKASFGVATIKAKFSQRQPPLTFKEATENTACLQGCKPLQLRGARQGRIGVYEFW